MRSTKCGSGDVSASSSTSTSPVLAATPRLRTAAARNPSSPWRTRRTPGGTTGACRDPSSATTTSSGGRV